MTKAIFIGYVSRFVSVSSGLIILPLVLTKLTQSEFNAWVVFSTAFLFQNVLDFGFSPTISRYYSYILGKSKREKLPYWLEKCELKTLNSIATTIYTFLTGVSFLLCTLFFVAYLPINDELSQFGFEWFIMAFSLCVNVFYLKNNALLSGFGRVIDVHYASLISNVIFFICSIILVFFGLGLLGLVTSRFLSVIAYRAYCALVIKRLNQEYTYNLNYLYENKYLFFKLLHQSSFVGVGTLGAFFSNRVLIFIVTSSFPAFISSQFNLVSMLFTTILSIALVGANSLSPNISRAVVQGDRCKIIRSYYEMIVSGVVVVLLGGGGLILYGGGVLDIISSDITIPSDNVLFLFLIICLFEVIYQVSISVCTSFNDIRYVKSQFISGFFSCGFILLILQWDSLRFIEYVLLVQIFSQAVFNYWYWPLAAIKHMKLGLVLDAKNG